MQKAKRINASISHAWAWDAWVTPFPAAVTPSEAYPHAETPEDHLRSKHWKPLPISVVGWMSQKPLGSDKANSTGALECLAAASPTPHLLIFK